MITISKWWDTDMADASQALYANPSMAIGVAVTPQDLAQQQAQARNDQEKARSKGGFLGALSGIVSKGDAWLSNIPGWGLAKQSVTYPLDKTAQGFRWLYTNAISRPTSTLLLQSAKAELGGGNYLEGMLGSWGDSWKHAEKISPGQAFANYENTAEASGQRTMLSGLFGDANLSSRERNAVKNNIDRFIYDTDYWKSKAGWKYNIGSGSLDFMFNVIDPVSAGVVGSAAKTIKGLRSVEFVPQAAAKAGKAGEAGVERTRGPILDLFGKQTPAEVAASPKFQNTFDWMKEEGRTVEEIANHPMWGRGRRINPARYDLAKLIHDTPRDNIEQLWRFSIGDSTAAADLAAQAPSVMKKIGQTMDNRVLLEGTRMNLAMLNHFKVNYEAGADSGMFAGPLTGDSGTKFPQLLEAPYPRPTTPGPRQSGWDATWGRLQSQANINRTAAAEISSVTPTKIVKPAEQTLLADAMKADQWRSDKLATLADDYDELINSENHLGRVLGDMDNWTPASSPLFGALGKAYRMGSLGLRNVDVAAERQTLKSAQGAGAKRYGGNFVMTSVKRGMGAPINIIHNFGNKVPEGLVDHNADDARDRVFDMLKQVKGMDPQARLGLIDIYNAAGNKMERSQALEKIHDAVMNHILINTHNLHPDIAEVLKGAIKDGIASKINELSGKSPTGLAQRFGPEATTPDEIAKLQGTTSDELSDLTPVRSDRVVTEEDGKGIVISPLAQTQLSSNDILFPVQEINRLVGRSSGSFQGFRGGVGEAKDWVVNRMDNFDNLWKAATLLRPGFVPRMVSDEILGRVFKFGGLATMMDMKSGMGHFFGNRARQIKAVMGHGSYVPGTGAGIASKRAIVSLEGDVAQKFAESGLEVRKLRVSPTLHMAYSQITDEKAAMEAARKELGAATRKRWKDDPGGSPEYINSLRERIQSHENAIKEYHDYVGEILRKAEDSVGRRLGDDDFEYSIGGVTYRVPKAYSSEWQNPVPRDQIGSHDSYKALFSRGEMLQRSRFWSHSEKTGAYKMIDPDQPNHMESWLDAINKQIRQDPFHRLIAGGADDATALRWMTKDPNGRAYMENLGYWNRDREQFIRNVRFMIDKYAGDDALKLKISKGEQVTEAELRSAFDQSEFPAVHGEEIKENSALFSRETAAHYLDNKIEQAWKYMADMPTDILSRHPLFLQMHQHEMENLIRQQFHYKMQNFGTEGITPKEWEQMNQKAAKVATKKMRQVVYDPVNTVGSQGLRFVYPFFKPFVDGVERWAGLVAERPEQLSKLSKIYNAPMAANLVTDSDGYHVDADGYATYKVKDPKTGKMKTERKFVPLADRVLHLRAPWADASSGDIPIRMQSLNTILPGDPWFDPGSGPIIQIGANQIAKTFPTAGDFLQWSKVLPYGPSDSTSDLLTPKYMKSAWDAYTAGDLDNVKYQQAVLDTYNMRRAQYLEAKRRGEHPKPPSMEQIQKDAKHFMFLSALTDWLSPASVKNSPLTGTKYQFYVDQFKALQAQDPANARDKFASMFGEDYLGFTTDLTKSMGISASQPAEKQAQKYKELIENDPDLAPLFVGDAYNGGTFSSSVYLKQMGEEIGGVRVRQRQTAEEAISDARVQEGWREYMAASKWLNSQLVRSGLRSYTQPGAEQFQEAKRALVQNLANKNPGWYEAFGTTDRNAIPRRIQAMKQLVTDPRVMNDPLRGDAKVLTQYLIVRDQFKQQLAQRGLQQLSFDENDQPTGQAADLGYAWRQYQMQLQNNSLQFESLFTRYLNNDDLQ